MEISIDEELNIYKPPVSGDVCPLPWISGCIPQLLELLSTDAELKDRVFHACNKMTEDDFKSLHFTLLRSLPSTEPNVSDCNIKLECDVTAFIDIAGVTKDAESGYFQAKDHGLIVQYVNGANKPPRELTYWNSQLLLKGFKVDPPPGTTIKAKQYFKILLVLASKVPDIDLFAPPEIYIGDLNIHLSDADFVSAVGLRILRLLASKLCQHIESKLRPKRCEQCSTGSGSTWVPCKSPKPCDRSKFDENGIDEPKCL